MDDNILIRDARADDAEFVGRCLLAAMEILPIDAEADEETAPLLHSVTRSCSREDDLYSYLRARIATTEGNPVGCIISYDGKDYKPLREATFDRLLKENGLDLRNNQQETEPGEYYLDCMAIQPEHRGKGIGHLLMNDRIHFAQSLGIPLVTLLVDTEHTSLADYYRQLGFAPIKEIAAYGTRYIKMGLQLQQTESHDPHIK